MTTVPLAIITGGGRGLGRATAIALASAGVDLIITYRVGADEAGSVVRAIEATGSRAFALQLDMNSPVDIADFSARLPSVVREHFDRDSIDYLVNNAGNSFATPLGGTAVAELDSLFAVHFRGPYLLTQGVEPLIADGGAIINVSSGLARFTAPGNSVYGAMKAAIDHVTRYWARELGARGVRVNSVAPGAVATDFGGGRNRDNEQLRAYLSAQTAMGRVGEPEDIGPLVAALLTGPTRWVTGQRIEASGGIFL